MALNFRDNYRQLTGVFLQPSKARVFEAEKNERTGEVIRTIPGGAVCFVELRHNTLPLIDIRKTFPHSAAAELAWFLSGDMSTDWINTQTSMWKPFEEDLVVETPSNRAFLGQAPAKVIKFKGVSSAYGHRWRSHFKVDQIYQAVQTLRRDPSSRRVWITTYSPEDMVDPGQKNVPCPVGFTLYISGGRLYSSYMLRSSDMFVGLPYDVMSHSLFMDAFAAQLRSEGVDVSLGSVMFTLSHPHMYEKYLDVLAEGLNNERPVNFAPLPMPGLTIDQILEDKDGYVDLIKSWATEKIDWPKFSPKIGVVL